MRERERRREREEWREGGRVIELDHRREVIVGGRDRERRKDWVRFIE